MRSKKAVFISALFMLIANSAFATPITGLIVDFRNSAWAGANGMGSYSVGDVMISAQPGGSKLYQDTTDGVGIASGEIDEIDAFELLRVDFLTTFYSAGVWVSDLFAAPDGSTPKGEVGYALVFYDFGSVTEYEFFGIDSDQGNGEQFIDFGTSLGLTRVDFYSSGNKGDEFSVIGFAPVPEPGSLILLGSGLVGLAYLKRRRS